MGKRELVIIAAFVAVGALAYQITAPPRAESEHGFSFSKLFAHIKDEISSDSASASVHKSGTLTLKSGVTEVRVSTVKSVPVMITGEDRDDIAYELPVESTGPDPARARAYADRTELREDDLGAVLALSIFFPREGTQTAKLTLRVPARLKVRLENSGRIHVADVAGVDLRNITGEAHLTGIAGAISGTHRSSELTVKGAGSVDLTLTSSRAQFHQVAGGLSLTGRNCDCVIRESKGALTATVTNGELTIDGHHGPIKVAGEGGRVSLLQPARDVSVDVRRMLVEIVAGEIGGSLTIITSDEPVRLTMDQHANVSLDAVATDGGKLDASDFNAQATQENRESRLIAAIGRGGPRIVLRNTRGDIVIKGRK